jgi:hypothetical protein
MSAGDKGTGKATTGNYDVELNKEEFVKSKSKGTSAKTTPVPRHIKLCKYLTKLLS